MTKPIISTPVMKYNGRADYVSRRALQRLCGWALLDFFGGDDAPAPRAIRLHGHARPVTGSKRVCLRLDDAWGEVRLVWARGMGKGIGRHFWFDFETWILKHAPFADRLKKGETVTVYVALEVVEAAK